MKGLENHIYLIGYLISNVVAALMLLATWKNTRLGRFLFFVLFAWASWTNGTIVSERPEVYLEYADLAFLSIYKQFINGWFSEHTRLMVGLVAFSQGLIAIAMLLKGIVLRVAAIGGIIFLMAIIPFGVGSGFPTTLIMAMAMLLILKSKNENYLWIRSKKERMANSIH